MKRKHGVRIKAQELNVFKVVKVVVTHHEKPLNVGLKRLKQVWQHSFDTRQNTEKTCQPKAREVRQKRLKYRPLRPLQF